VPLDDHGIERRGQGVVPKQYPLEFRLGAGIRNARLHNLDLIKRDADFGPGHILVPLGLLGLFLGRRPALDQ
jgi:hypothetical protein